MFCDVQLAARIERAERDLVVSAFAAGAPAGAFALSIGGGVAACTVPGSPLNKVIGVGFEALPDAAAWTAIEREYAVREVPVQVEVSTLAAPECARQLTERGYRLVGVENVLGRELTSAPPTLPAGLQIDRSPDHEIDMWADVVATGFAAPDTQGVAPHEAFDRAAIDRILREFGRAAGVIRYLARRDGQLLGGGSMRLEDGIAQLCGAATLPAARRQGVQTALLAWRLTDAAAHGGRLAVVTTQPGSKSMQNVQRQGFQLLYSRLVLVR